MSPLDQWTRVTEISRCDAAMPANFHGAFTVLEWCHLQVAWMQKRNISARVHTGTDPRSDPASPITICFIETKPRK